VGVDTAADLAVAVEPLLHLVLEVAVVLGAVLLLVLLLLERRRLKRLA
jgi:Flp pilus assembly protein protease CpaA